MRKKNVLRGVKEFASHLSIQTKLISMFLATSLLAFFATTYMHANINSALLVIEKAYTSNEELNEISEALNGIQQNMKEYLDSRSSDSLSGYYSCVQEYSNRIQELNAQTIGRDSAIMEKNIRGISASYLAITGEAVEAKRARDINRYSISYDDASNLYNYLNAYVFSLNNRQFKDNSANYSTLAVSLELLGRITTVINVIVALFNVLLIYLLTRQITRPLKALSKSANAVAEGNFDIPDLPVHSMDEVGVVTKTFNKMVDSIREYILRIKESMDAENEAKERELLMKNHLKDAQLKYYQAQIHPHFLFNTLNAGAQLAMLENAERTYSFVQKMSEFFRYSMNNLEKDVYLREELELVESYIYIMNVRFSGEIYFEKEVTCDIEGIRVPSMILQPLVENAVQYGIRDIDWQGRIVLSIKEESSRYCICVADNGKGILKERLEEVQKGIVTTSGDKELSNGVGLGNVRERLELYYKEDALFSIESEGEEKGTQVYIFIPKVSTESRERKVRDKDV